MVYICKNVIMTYVTGTNPKNQIYHDTYNYSQVNAAAYGICSCASVARMRFFGTLANFRGIM